MVGDLYDFHSHILPGVDDGYPDVESAICALKLSYAQGVRYMVATPHYYYEESVESFLQRRDEGYARLKQAMEQDGGPFPELCLGAEVAYYPNISYMEGLERLCIGQSNYLLLEMPFRSWGIEVLRDIQNICNMGEVVPVLAHIERYIHLLNKKSARQILDMNLRMQMNGEFVLAKRSRRLARRILKESPAFLLGTDCHNLKDRKPELGDAVQVLRNHGMEPEVRRSLELSQALWSEAVG